MRASLTIVAMLVSLGLAPASAEAQKWTGLAFVNAEAGTDRDSDITRVRARITRAPKTCDGGRLEIEARDPSKNYLQQAYVACKAGPWTVKAGRLFLSAMTQSPPPFLLTTPGYQSAYSYSVFAYGAQAERLVGDWAVTLDVTGKSGLRYTESGQFDRLEASGRAFRVGGGWTIGAAIQISEDFLRTGIDGEKWWGRTRTNAFIGYTTERKSLDGFLLTQLRVTPWLQPLAQIDRAKNKTTLSAGVAIYPAKGLMAVVMNDGKKTHGRAQLFVKW